MKVGTRSVLYGAHCFFLHPWFVAWAWWRLYGFPWDPRLWVAFFVHDLGYWGKPNMDGPEGEKHVEWGARLMYRWFDSPGPLGLVAWLFGNQDHDLVVSVNGRPPYRTYSCRKCGEGGFVGNYSPCYSTHWHDFSLLHSRFYAKKLRKPVSRLCYADKLAICLTPSWLYLPLVRATGEIREYMALAESRTAAGEPKYASMALATSTEERWYFDVQEYIRRWVEEHSDGREDRWTPSQGST